MNAMTTSRWDTGTYELLVSKDPDGREGDLMVVVFARPMDPEDTASNEDAPILAHIDVAAGEYDWELQDYHFGMRTIGEKGLLQPEMVHRIYGEKLGLRILLALYQAADRDFRGTDMDAVPWRPPSEEAFPLMRRTYLLLMELRDLLNGQEQPPSP